MDSKQTRGQFYTSNCDYILDGLPLPPDDIRCILEPFAGKGDLLRWIKKHKGYLPIEAYDIEPKYPGVQQRDTLHSPPNYEGYWILTNPPYLARNKSTNKSIYNLYNTNDLYKCFLLSLVKEPTCRGGICILPAGFFLSPRDIDRHCRNEFLTRFRLIKVKYFEEQVFEDTTSTVVAFAFEKSRKPLNEQVVEWTHMPSKESKIFHLTAANHWIIGGDIYFLPVPPHVQIRRHIEGLALKEGEQQTWMTLYALDSGTHQGRIRLEYKKGYVYPADESSRSFATLRIQGRQLTDTEQITICRQFNEFLESRRTSTWSLCLPQYREYGRRRIPFELAYTIVRHFLQVPGIV